MVTFTYIILLITLLFLARIFAISKNSVKESTIPIPNHSTPRIIMHGGISLTSGHPLFVNAIIDNATFYLSGDTCAIEPIRIDIVLRHVSQTINAFASMIEMGDIPCTNVTRVEGIYHFAGQDSKQDSEHFSISFDLEKILFETPQSETLMSPPISSKSTLPPLKIDSLARMTGRSVSYKKFDIALILPPRVPVKSIKSQEDTNSTLSQKVTTRFPSRSSLMPILLNQTRLSLASTFEKTLQLARLQAQTIDRLFTVLGWSVLIIALLMSIDQVRQQQQSLKGNDVVTMAPVAVAVNNKEKLSSTSRSKSTHSTIAPVIAVNKGRSPSRSGSALSSAEYDLIHRNTATGTTRKLSSFTANVKGDAEKHVLDACDGKEGQEGGDLYAVRKSVKRSSKRKSPTPRRGDLVEKSRE